MSPIYFELGVKTNVQVATLLLLLSLVAFSSSTEGRVVNDGVKISCSRLVAELSI